MTPDAALVLSHLDAPTGRHALSRAARLDLSRTSAALALLLASQAVVERGDGTYHRARPQRARLELTA